MRRKSFDTLVSVTGLALAAILLTASGLLFWTRSSSATRPSSPT